MRRHGDVVPRAGVSGKNDLGQSAGSRYTSRPIFSIAFNFQSQRKESKR